MMDAIYSQRVWSRVYVVVLFLVVASLMFLYDNPSSSEHFDILSTLNKAKGTIVDTVSSMTDNAKEVAPAPKVQVVKSTPSARTDTSSSAQKFCNDMAYMEYNPDGCVFNNPITWNCTIREGYEPDVKSCLRKLGSSDLDRFPIFYDVVSRLFENYRIVDNLHFLMYVVVDVNTITNKKVMDVRFKDTEYNGPSGRFKIGREEMKFLFASLVKVCLASLSIAKLTHYRPDEVIAPSMFSTGRITIPIPEIASEEYFNIIENAIAYVKNRKKMVDVLQGSRKAKYLENMTVQLGLLTPDAMKILKNPPSEYGIRVKGSSAPNTGAYTAQLERTEAYIRSLDEDFRRTFTTALRTALKYKNYTSQNILAKGFT